MTTTATPDRRSRKVIAVLGASGRAGREIIDSALAHGYHVVALVRHPGSFPPTRGLEEVVWPHVSDTEALTGAFDGASAVVSALGSDAHGPSTICTDGIRTAMSVMRTTHVTRLIAISAYGVRETRHTSLYSRAVWAKVPNTLRDLEAMEAIIETSGLDWTVVRPPRLTTTRRAESYTIGEEVLIHLWHVVDRNLLAAFIVDEIAGRQFVHQHPAIRG